MKELIPNLPSAISPPLACRDASSARTQTSDETEWVDPEHLQNPLSRTPRDAEPEWDIAERPQNPPSRQPGDAEPERNDAERLQNSLAPPVDHETAWHNLERSQNALSPAPRPDEPDWDDSEHSQNALPLPPDDDEPEWDDPEPFQRSFSRRPDDETRWHELEDFQIPHAEYLCERQQLAIRLLLIGEREGKVAEKVGVGRTTLWRWRKDTHFRSALAACRKLAYANAIERLQGLVSRAVDRVEEQLEGGNAMAPFRLIRLARADNDRLDDASS